MSKKNMLNESSRKLARDWSKAALSGQVDSRPRVEVACRSQGWGFLRHGRSIVDEPLCIGGRVFSSGFGSHADSEIVLKLPSREKQFCAFVGMDKNIHSAKGPTQKGRIVFSVEAGGKELFASEPLGLASPPIIEDILSADFSWPAATTTMLYRSRGSTAIMEDFLYSKDRLAPGTKVRMTPIDGRSSNSWLPFFNIETGKEGFVMAIGWTGAWRAEFDRVDEDLLKIRAGLERTRLVLHPGEEIRLPRILLVFWEGEPLTGHNLLRRFLVRHGTPRPGGQPPVTPVSFATWGGTLTSAHLGRIAELKTEHAGCDCYWIDAGWYGPKGTDSASVFSGEWGKHVGHWSVNPTTHPDGLRPISDAARKAGMKFLLWLEPERAKPGTLWPKEHPEWFLGTPSY
ncbi:MAG: NPCBM/NEW2 domain-containing protein [Kiritimatiellia bacterium]|nr:NPCBM/NEW2 domain-containing protein [Kiritimatiellia bacterium]